MLLFRDERSAFAEEVLSAALLTLCLRFCRGGEAGQSQRQGVQ